MACALVALAGPGPKAKAEIKPWSVVVDRSPSMYLNHGASSSNHRIEAARLAWLELGLEGPVEFIDSGLVGLGVHGDWPGDWTKAPPARRDEVAWANWDRPHVLWLTDDGSGLQPVHASMIAVGGTAHPGPVALVRGGVLVQDGSGGITEEARASMAVTGGNRWPAAWAEYARLWTQDRDLRWAPIEPASENSALHLYAPRFEVGDPAIPFDLDMGSYRIRGTWDWGVWRGEDSVALQLEVDRSAVDIGSWIVAEESRLTGLLGSGPGWATLRVKDWEPVAGDLGAFAVDFARRMDMGRRFPADVIPALERRAAQPATEGLQSVTQVGTSESSHNSPWAPWFSIAALLCLLASFAVGKTRRRVGR